MVTPSGTDGVDLSSSQGGAIICQTSSAFSTDPVETSGAFEQAHHGHFSRLEGSTVVGKSHQSPVRFTAISSSSLSCDHDRCIGKWLGSCPGRLSLCSGSVESGSTDLAHKRIGTQGGGLGSVGVSSQDSGSGGLDQDGQCDYLCLHKQDGGYSVSQSVYSTLAHDDVDQTVSHFSASGLCSRDRECAGRPFVASSFVPSRKPTATVTSECAGSEGVEAQQGSSPVCVSPSGSASGGLVCHGTEQATPSVLLDVPEPERPSTGLFHLGLERVSRVCLPSDFYSKESGTESDEGQGNSDSHSTQVAEQAVVLGPATLPHSASVSITSSSGSAVSDRSVASKSSVSRPDSLADLRDRLSSEGLPEDVVHTMLQSRSTGTKNVYQSHWRSFGGWCGQRDIDPFTATVKDVLMFLQHLFDSGLAPSTLYVYCNSIGTLRGKIDGYSVVSHPEISMWLKGAKRMRPPVKDVMPRWDLGMVISALMESPYEPAQRATLEAWTKKTAFLLAITTAARSCELQALDIREELTVIHKKYVSFRPNPAFVPKVMNDNYINRNIVIDAFFPDFDRSDRLQQSWNSVCPVRAVSIYLDKTKTLRKPDQFQLFVSFGKRTLGQPVKSSTIAKWIVDTVSAAYTHMGRDAPQRIRAHSTRAASSSLACLAGVSVSDICRATTWSSSNVFTSRFVCTGHLKMS